MTHGIFSTESHTDIGSCISLVVAVLSNENEVNTKNTDASVELHPLELTLEKFKCLFYPNHSGYFNINHTCLKNESIVFLNQKYSSNHSDDITFSLYDLFLKTYCAKNHISENSLNPLAKIILQRDTYGLQSLLNLSGKHVTLSYGEIIFDLTSKGSIVKSENPSASALVCFKIIGNIHNVHLDTTVSVVFNFNVKIPGYINPSGISQLYPYTPCPSKKKCNKNKKRVHNEKCLNFDNVVFTNDDGSVIDEDETDEIELDPKSIKYLEKYMNEEQESYAESSHAEFDADAESDSESESESESESDSVPSSEEDESSEMTYDE